MKKIAKNSLSVLLAVILATTMFVSAFAVVENPYEITMYNMNIDYKTNEVFDIYFVIEGCSVLSTDDFVFSIYDSQQNEVFNESMCDAESYLPDFFGSAKSIAVSKSLSEILSNEPDEYMLVSLYVNEEFVVNPDETYTIVFAAGSFANAEGALSEEISYEFLPSDYIYIPTIWDKILSFLHSDSFFEFVFARLIMIIEFFYYGSFGV